MSNKKTVDVDNLKAGDTIKDMSNVTLGNLVSVSEAAERLGISDVLVLRYISEKRIAAEKVGRIWLIDSESLETFAARPRRPGNPNFKRLQNA